MHLNFGGLAKRLDPYLHKGINNGKGGTVAWVTVIALLSVSMVENVPGFAVAPVFGKLRHVLPGGASEGAVQALAIVPNLVIIPFMLLSGWLTGHRGVRKRLLLAIGLGLFAGSALMYMLAPSMAMLQLASVVLGIGTGLMLPLDTALIADLFAGRQRTRLMGWAIAVSTFMMVPVTYAVGWLGDLSNWHMPFAVYFLALVPLAMCPFINETNYRDHVEARKKAVAAEGSKAPGGYIVSRLWQVIAVYFLITLSSMVVSFYLPFLMSARHLATETVGTAVAAFYLVRFGVGMWLPHAIELCRGWATQVFITFIIVGLAVMALLPTELWAVVGVGLIGVGYGLYQPLLFDMAPDTVRRPSLVTMAVAIMLVADCSAYTAAPYLLDALAHVCGVHGQVGLNLIPVWMVVAACVGVLAWSLRRPQDFAFYTLPRKEVTPPTKKANLP